MRAAAPQPPRRLLASTAWNPGGQLVPLLVGIAVLPLLIRTLGLDRYGFLTLVWVLVGYASIFDMGIGRVLVHVVARDGPAVFVGLLGRCLLLEDERRSVLRLAKPAR